MDGLRMTLRVSSSLGSACCCLGHLPAAALDPHDSPPATSSETTAGAAADGWGSPKRRQLPLPMLLLLPRILLLLLPSLALTLIPVATAAEAG